MDIGAWLRELGLGQYEAVLCDNAVDGAILPKLTADDLKEIGVIAIGHRRRLVDAIAALNLSGRQFRPIGRLLGRSSVNAVTPRGSGLRCDRNR